MSVEDNMITYSISIIWTIITVIMVLYGLGCMILAWINPPNITECDFDIVKERRNMLHRVDGPAIERRNGDKEWWVNGRLHRLDGPAIERADGSKAWYLDGNPYTEAEIMYTLNAVYSEKIREYAEERRETLLRTIRQRYK